MMYLFNLKDAKKDLTKLIEIVASGEEVQIIGNDGSVYKIAPLIEKKPRPKFGSAKGLIQMSDDFDDHINNRNY